MPHPPYVVGSKELAATRPPGITLYSYTLRTEWCYNGTRIVGTPYVIRHVSTAPGVSFEGNVELQHGWIGSGYISYRTYTQGHFKTAFVSRYPWITTIVRHNGTHEHSSGG
jgi:hypothetical protein